MKNKNLIQSFIKHISLYLSELKPKNKFNYVVITNKSKSFSKSDYSQLS